MRFSKKKIKFSSLNHLKKHAHKTLMKRETITIILTTITLIPMTFWLFLSIYGLKNMLTNFDSNNIPIGLAMVFGIIGYIGLIMNLKTEKKLKSECINFVFLLVGIIGFILFHSIEGGITAWKWIIFMEEPNEWIIFVGPMLMTIIITVMKGNLLLKGYKGNKSENTN